MRKYQITADAASTTSWSILIYFLFAVGDNLNLVRYAEIKFEIKSQHPISIGNIFGHPSMSFILLAMIFIRFHFFVDVPS